MSNKRTNVKFNALSLRRKGSNDRVAGFKLDRDYIAELKEKVEAAKRLIDDYEKSFVQTGKEIEDIGEEIRKSGLKMLESWFRLMNGLVGFSNGQYSLEAIQKDIKNIYSFSQQFWNGLTKSKQMIDVLLSEKLPTNLSFLAPILAIIATMGSAFIQRNFFATLVQKAREYIEPRLNTLWDAIVGQIRRLVATILKRLGFIVDDNHDPVLGNLGDDGGDDDDAPPPNGGNVETQVTDDTRYAFQIPFSDNSARGPSEDDGPGPGTSGSVPLVESYTRSKNSKFRAINLQTLIASIGGVFRELPDSLRLDINLLVSSLGLKISVKNKVERIQKRYGNLLLSQDIKSRLPLVTFNNTTALSSKQLKILKYNNNRSLRRPYPTHSNSAQSGKKRSDILLRNHPRNKRIVKLKAGNIEPASRQYGLSGEGIRALNNELARKPEQIPESYSNLGEKKYISMLLAKVSTYQNDPSYSLFAERIANEYKFITDNPFALHSFLGYLENKAMYHPKDSGLREFFKNNQYYYSNSFIWFSSQTELSQEILFQNIPGDVFGQANDADIDKPQFSSYFLQSLTDFFSAKPTNFSLEATETNKNDNEVIFDYPPISFDGMHSDAPAPKIGKSIPEGNLTEQKNQLSVSANQRSDANARQAIKDVRVSWSQVISLIDDFKPIVARYDHEFLSIYTNFPLPQYPQFIIEAAKHFSRPITSSLEKFAEQLKGYATMSIIIAALSIATNWAVDPKAFAEPLFWTSFMATLNSVSAKEPLSIDDKRIETLTKVLKNRDPALVIDTIRYVKEIALKANKRLTTNEISKIIISADRYYPVLQSIQQVNQDRKYKLSQQNMEHIALVLTGFKK